jgi:hypothetical protein
MQPSDQDQQGGGESYEFSFRPRYGTRVFVHVPKATLEVLRRSSGPRDSLLSLLARHNTALCSLALARSREEETTTVVVTEEDAESILAGVTNSESSTSS